MNPIPSFCALCALVLLGKVLRTKVRLFQKLYLPSSVLGGILGLVVLQLAGSYLPEIWTAGWSRLPGILINVVFAALFLGITIPSLSTIWKQAGPQLAYGQIVAWGQYVVGIGLVLFLLGPLFGVSPLFGVIVPVGFEGGHGTAGGLGPMFEDLGWSEGKDYGLAAATAGIVSAIVVGMVLVNWAARRRIVRSLRKPDDATAGEWVGIYPPDRRPPAGYQTVSAESVDSLALHLAIVGLAIGVGYAIKEGLVALESAVPAMSEKKILRAFPLFPLCMIGGIVVQIGLTKGTRSVPVDRQLMQRIGGTALDFLVVAAISTIRMEVIAEGLLPFAAIVLGGIAWNIFCVMWLARRLLPDAWFERAIAEMGQSMGVTATGLLLLRVVDPESETEAASAFGYKQLLHEPFMGGGLWTSSAVILLVSWGAGIVFAISLGAIVAWLVAWRLLIKGR